MGLLCMNANKPGIKLKNLYGKFLPGLEDEYAYEFTPKGKQTIYKKKI